MLIDLRKPENRIRLLKNGTPIKEVEKLYIGQHHFNVLMGYHGEIEGFK